MWSIDDALGFLRGPCGLRSPLPGFVTETHDELFTSWRKAISDGVLLPPFNVTHIDAHADLGNGDAGYKYIMTALLFSSPEERQFPSPGPGETGLTEGNFLLFAIACRWISQLEYVYGPGGGGDEIAAVMRGFDLKADAVQLAAMTKKNYRYPKADGYATVPVAHLEPEVPYRSTKWDKFHAESTYDFACITRSPLYAPSTADPLYDEIIANFIKPI